MHSTRQPATSPPPSQTTGNAHGRIARIAPLAMPCLARSSERKLPRSRPTVTAHRLPLLLCLLFALTGSIIDAEEPLLNGRSGRDLLLKYFRPRPTLKVAAHHLTRARFPVVDVHTHFRYKRRNLRDGLAAYVELMDRHNIAICASLDGKLGEDFAEHRTELWQQYRDRFVIFVNIDFQGTGSKEDPATWDCQRPDFARRVAQQLAQAHKQGASGLKLFKQFGLGYRNPDGSLIAIDDLRWDPIWKACGELDFLFSSMSPIRPRSFILSMKPTNGGKNYTATPTGAFLRTNSPVAKNCSRHAIE